MGALAGDVILPQRTGAGKGNGSRTTHLGSPFEPRRTVTESAYWIHPAKWQVGNHDGQPEIGQSIDLVGAIDSPAADA